MNELYDVFTNDGLRLNEQPLSYSAAESFALDALIDSEIEEVNIVESIRPGRLSRLPWLVLVGIVTVASMAVVIVAAIVVKGA